MPSASSAIRRRMTLVAAALVAAASLGADCSPPPVSIQMPWEAQVIDDPSVVATARVARVLDETTGELLVDGVDLLDALGALPPFSNLSGVVQIGGVPVQVSELTWAEPAGSFDTVSVRLAGLAPVPHLLQVRAFDSGAAALRSASRGFTVSSPLALVLESWDAGGLAFGAQGLPLGEASAASLGAGISGGVVPLAGGESLREGLPAAAAALEGAP
jgi:hypothetical protein